MSVEQNHLLGLLKPSVPLKASDSVDLGLKLRIKFLSSLALEKGEGFWPFQSLLLSVLSLGQEHPNRLGAVRNEDSQAS